MTDSSQIMARCPNGHQFPFGISIGGPGEVTIINGVAPCPVCGALGEIEDGSYTVDAGGRIRRRDVTALIEVLASMHRDGLASVLDAVQRAYADPGSTSIDEVVETVGAASPQAASILRSLLASESGVVAAWLAVVLAAITMIISLRPAETSGQSPTQEEIAQIVDVALASIDTSGTAVARPPKVGRNEPCWCGSGNKFKRCHGGIGGSALGLVGD